MHSFDVVISGGGLVGLSLAIGLQGSGLRVAIVESQAACCSPFSPLTEQPGSRVSAINAASEHWLTHLGVWPQLIKTRITPYNAMRIWDRDSFGEVTFTAQAGGHRTLGNIIENQVIERALWQRVEQCSDVKVFAGTALKQVAWGENEAFIHMQDGQMLSAKLVVGAEGATSWLRQHADVTTTFWDYGHHALVATIRTERPHENCARQVFHGDGILAFLPLWQPNLCSIVWSLPPERAEKMQELDAESFNRQLAVAFDMQLGLCQLEGARCCLPLKAHYAHAFAGHRFALIGDAAHRIHPLAGQGVNLGFMDAATLTCELRRLHKEGKDSGQHLYLRRYERRRKYSAAKMLATMQGLRELFSGEHPAKKWLRDVGMQLVNHAPGIKPLLRQQAMGLDDLPDELQSITFN